MRGAFAVGGGVLVLLAYGVGWILARFLPFTVFEATLFSLIGLSALGMTVAHFIITAISTNPPKTQAEEGEDEEEWEEEDEEELEDIFSEPNEPDWPSVSGRHSRRMIDFSNVKPDDRCPCGSGRKYKNCHGRGMKNQPRSIP